jgi:F-type H+-transporting ATPase subunit delta
VSAHAQPTDYARAIFDLAIEDWTRQLRGIEKALAASSTLRAAAGDSSVPVAQRLQVIEAAAPPGGLNEGVRKVLGTLLDAGQMGLLGPILAEMEQIARPKAERRLARVSSAVPLSGSERATIQSRLTSKFGSDLDFQFDVDAALLGGVLLRIGDQVIDGSVAGKLAAMRGKLTA